jgi:hypothetical protein
VRATALTAGAVAFEFVGTKPPCRTSSEIVYVLATRKTLRDWPQTVCRSRSLGRPDNPVAEGSFGTPARWTLASSSYAATWQRATAHCPGKAHWN